MDKFECCTLTLHQDRQEVEMEDFVKKQCLDYINRKEYKGEGKEEYLETSLKPFREYQFKDVVIVKIYDALGNGQEKIKDYLEEHNFIRVQKPYDRGGYCTLLSWDSDRSYWSSNYPIEVLAKYIAILGQEGWEVVEYKFNTEGFGFAQALLKRKIQTTE